MLNLSGFTCFSFPTTVLFVDDNQSFLSSLSLKIDNKLITRQLNEPIQALKLLKSQYRTEEMVMRCLQEMPEKTSQDPLLKLDLTSLHQTVYDKDRFDEVSVLVVDHDMPGMSGIELCRSLKDKRIKKIMLTGVADSNTAVRAFNEGIIDRFILKCSTTIFEDLNHMIRELQRAYFQDISRPLYSAALSHDNSILIDRSFKNFFNELCYQKQISEYYLLDVAGNFLLVNYNGKPWWLIVKHETELDENRRCDTIVFEKLPGDGEHYYALTERNDRYNLDNDRIFSHEKYLILPEKFLRHTFDYDLNEMMAESDVKHQEQSIDFTPRELDCIVLLMQGYTFKMIANKLGISPRTVETYIENIKQKTGCFSKSELIKFLQKQRISH